MNAETEQLLGLARAFPLFAAATDDELRDLVADAHRSSVPAGWCLVRGGTPADACYLVLGGHATVRRPGRPDRTIGAGDVVGDVALVGTGAGTTVTAVEPTALLHLDLGRLRELLTRAMLRTALLRRLDSGSGG